MPEYTITIRGIDYEVSSPTELTDAQAYAYAKPQADADFQQADDDAAAAQAKAEAASHGGRDFFRGALAPVASMAKGLMSLPDTLPDALAQGVGQLVNPAEANVAQGRSVLSLIQSAPAAIKRALTGQFTPEESGRLAGQAALTLAPSVASPLRQLVTSPASRATVNAAGLGVEQLGKNIRPTGILGAAEKAALKATGQGMQSFAGLKPPVAPRPGAGRPLVSTSTGRVPLDTPPPPSAPIPSPLVPAGPTSTATGGLRVPAPPAPPTLPPGLLPTATGAGGGLPVAPGGFSRPVMLPTPPVRVRPGTPVTSTGAAGTGVLPSGDFGRPLPAPAPPPAPVVPPVLRATGTGTQSNIIPAQGFSVPAPRPVKTATTAASKSAATTKAAEATPAKATPAGEAKAPAPANVRVGNYTPRAINTANGILKRRNLPEITDPSKATAVQKEILDDVVSGRKHAESEFKKGK